MAESGSSPGAADELVRFGELVRSLRARCPWDRRQTHRSLAPHLLEEAYEALDTIDVLAREEPDVSPAVVAHFREELGDVLFQVFFHAELASERGRFTIADVARTVHDKLVSRHPHVFGEASAATAEEVADRWEVLKRSEKQRRGVPDGVPETMPALALAAKLLRRASSLGAVLPGAGERHAQLRRSVDGLGAGPVPGRGETQAEAGDEGGGDERAEGAERGDPEAVDRVGEALLALVDLARREGVDPETALRAQALRLRDELDARG